MLMTEYVLKKVWDKNDRMRKHWRLKLHYTFIFRESSEPVRFHQDHVLKSRSDRFDSPFDSHACCFTLFIIEIMLLFFLAQTLGWTHRTPLKSMPIKQCLDRFNYRSSFVRLQLKIFERAPMPDWFSMGQETGLCPCLNSSFLSWKKIF